MSRSEKARYWVAILYPENMVDNWEDKISTLLQVPYVYCVHDKDLCSDGSIRKCHVHIMIAWANTTTYKSALSCFKRLEKEGCVAIPNDKIEIVQNVRFMFNYLIHDTDDCKKKHKYLYPSAERISGNGFDIGCFEQLSIIDNERILDDLEQILISKPYMNYGSFYRDIKADCELTKEYSIIARKNHGFLEALCRGFYLEFKRDQEQRDRKAYYDLKK